MSPTAWRIGFSTVLGLIISGSAASLTLGQSVKSGPADLLLRFAGVWDLNTKESTGPLFHSNDSLIGTYWELSIKADQVIIYKHYPPKSRWQSYEITLNLNGQSETNNIPENRTDQPNKLIQVESRTWWKKDKLIRKFKEAPDDNWHQFRVFEEFRLSKDGTKLVYSQDGSADPMSSFPGIAIPFELIFYKRK